MYISSQEKFTLINVYLKASDTQPRCRGTQGGARGATKYWNTIEPYNTQWDMFTGSPPNWGVQRELQLKMRLAGLHLRFEGIITIVNRNYLFISALLIRVPQIVIRSQTMGSLKLRLLLTGGCFYRVSITFLKSEGFLYQGLTLFLKVN